MRKPAGYRHSPGTEDGAATGRKNLLGSCARGSDPSRGYRVAFPGSPAGVVRISRSDQPMYPCPCRPGAVFPSPSMNPHSIRRPPCRAFPALRRACAEPQQAAAPRITSVTRCEPRGYTSPFRPETPDARPSTSCHGVEKPDHVCPARDRPTTCQIMSAAPILESKTPPGLMTPRLAAVVELRPAFTGSSSREVSRIDVTQRHGSMYKCVSTAPAAQLVVAWKRTPARTSPWAYLQSRVMP